MAKRVLRIHQPEHHFEADSESDFHLMKIRLYFFSSVFKRFPRMCTKTIELLSPVFSSVLDPRHFGTDPDADPRIRKF